jgi:putative intracellular protease/amidase
MAQHSAVRRVCRFRANVIVDRELITGPNPPSDHPIAEKLIEALASSHSRTSAVGRA